MALAPNNKFAFVANAAANSVTVIKINNPNVGGFAAVVEKTIRTGAEPWNIVISPDGKRVFVANSGQDTISVINALTRNLIGNVRLRSSLCNEGDGARHFQPRGLAVSLDSKQLYVTRFLSFTKPGGVQGDDDGKQGVVCRLDINTASPTLAGYKPAAVIPLPAQATGFNIVVNNTVVPNTNSTAFPNQLQSIVLRGTRGYLPNIAASPESPLQFQNSTQAYVNFIEGVGGASQTSLPALNLHLGARDPEAGKKKLFFANPWGIAFTTPSGVGTAYAISAGSDLLVKLNVDGLGNLSFTGGDRTTRYIDLNDPLDPATSGSNAGKNPRGIVIKTDGPAPLAYVANFVSRNISVVDLTQDKVIQVIRTTALPPPGSGEEQVQVGAEMFFSGRGHFSGPPGLTVSADERLSQDGWQNCASCHFEGLTDGVVWFFGPGPRKSIPMSGSFNPRNRSSAAHPELLGATRRDPGLHAQCPQRVRPGPIGHANRLQRAGHQPTADPVDHPKHLRPQPRPVAGRRQHQSAAVRRERLPQAQYRAHASHRDPARQHHGLAGDGRVERLDPVRDPGAQWPAHRPGDPGWRVVGRDRRRPRAVQAGEVHGLPQGRTMDRVGQELHRRHRWTARSSVRPSTPLSRAPPAIATYLRSSATPTTASTSTNS